MNFLIKQFQQISTKQLFEIYKLRSRVFVVEQNCAYQDVDELDLEAWHIMLLDNKGLLVAYCRIIPPASELDSPHIGRVVVDPANRGKRLGIEIMKLGIQKTNEIFAGKSIVISAQAYLNKFYSSLGFVAEGEGYLEDDIPHIKMVYPAK
ncbi:MAG: GNAT family N-acetyltransferase [bacterium]|nr:GNAT family N-acetyltransferase [bacterium]